MFGWRKRNDGFEWRQYVRTTILVRREKRRQKLDDVREAAVNKVKEAGEKGARAGAAGAEKVGKAAKAGLDSAAKSLKGASSTVWERMSAATRQVLSSAGRILGETWRTFAKRAGDLMGVLPGGGLSYLQVLLAVAAVAGFWAVARYTSLGVDGEVKIAAAIASAALGVAGLLAFLAMPQGAGTLNYAKGVLDRVGDGVRDIPILSSIRGLGPRTIAAGAVTAVLALGGWLWIGSGGKPSLATLVPLGTGTAESVSGRAVAVSGDSLRVSGKVIRLAGIEAPERNQKCVLAGTKRWDCGNAAAQALAARIKSKSVRCEIADGKSSTTAPAGNPATAVVRGVCVIDGSDIAADLVKSGHVFAESGWFARYSGLEGEARTAKAGLWRGEAERPSDYRAKRWDEARRAAPEGCPIKGQMSSDGRVYVLPWAPQYDRIKIRTAKGERWFCSEAEAQAAGWKPIQQQS